MRGLVPGLPNPHPLGLAMPALYQGSGFVDGFLAALDDVVAPLVHCLDNFDAYLDPALTPPDFLPWLAGWVGIELDENWSLAQQRRMVATAVELYRWRGTRRGVVELIASYAGIDPAAIEVSDSGGAAWSSTPGGSIPGRPQPSVEVRVHAADSRELDVDRLDRLVALAKPAHVEHRVEVVAL